MQSIRFSRLVLPLVLLLSGLSPAQAQETAKPASQCQMIAQALPGAILASLASPALELAQAQGRPTQAGIMVDLRFTRQELAELAGVSRETFARLLTKFQHLGVLTIERRKLLIPDPHRLEELA